MYENIFCARSNRESRNKFSTNFQPSPSNSWAFRFFFLRHYFHSIISMFHQCPLPLEEQECLSHDIGIKLGVFYTVYTIKSSYFLPFFCMRMAHRTKFSGVSELRLYIHSNVSSFNYFYITQTLNEFFCARLQMAPANLESCHFVFEGSSFHSDTTRRMIPSNLWWKLKLHVIISRPRIIWVFFTQAKAFFQNFVF